MKARELLLEIELGNKEYIMKARELLEALACLSEDKLELEVRVYADHGQCAMAANNVFVGRILEEEYMADLVEEEDYEDSIQVLVIE